MIRASGSSPALALSRQYADAQRVMQKVPFRWTLMTASHSSSDMLKIMRSRRMPALLTTTSRRPKASIAVSTTRREPSQSETSSALATASPSIWRISAATSSATEPFRSVPSTLEPTSLTTTLAPWRANSMASPRPIPRPAPVTTTTRPSQNSVMSPSLAALLFDRGGRFLGEPQGPLPDYVPLDLAGAREDGAGAAGHESCLPTSEVVGAGFSLPVGLAARGVPLAGQHRVGAEQTDSDLAETLVVLRPEQLVDAGLRAGLTLGGEGGEQAQTLEPHQLHVRVRPGQVLANQGFTDPAPFGRLVDERPELALVAQVLGGRRSSPLVAEGRHGDPPPVVEPPDHVEEGGPAAVDELLAETGSTGGLSQRPDLDTVVVQRS